MTGINMVFFRGGPQLGELEAGVLANWLGAVFSVVSGGVGCLVAVAWVAAKTPALRRYGSGQPEAPAATSSSAFCQACRGGSRSTLGTCSCERPDCVSTAKSFTKRTPARFARPRCLPISRDGCPRRSGAPDGDRQSPRRRPRNRRIPERRAGCDVGRPDSRLSRRAAGCWKAAAPRPHRNHHGRKRRVLDSRGRGRDSAIRFGPCEWLSDTCNPAEVVSQDRRSVGGPGWRRTGVSAGVTPSRKEKPGWRGPLAFAGQCHVTMVRNVGGTTRRTCRSARANVDDPRQGSPCSRWRQT